MPTTPNTTWSGRKLEPAFPPHETDAVGPFASGSYPRGTVLGQVSATGVWKPYANGNNDGSETAKVIAMYDMYSDGTNVSITEESALTAGESATNAPVYIKGYFRCEELEGLDSNAVADLGRLLYGNVDSGILSVF